MRILSRAVFREVFISASVGSLLFIFVLFLRTIEKLATYLVRASVPTPIIGKLLLYALPSTLPLALPLGVLVGILIGLSRMSSDNEITAMRASGVSSSAVVRPVLLLAFLAMAVTALTSLWLAPLSLHLETLAARNFTAAQLTGNIETRIFNEQFPNTVLYVGDVQTIGKQNIWHQVFIADITKQEDLEKQGKNRADSPRVMVAEQAIPTADAAHNRIILDMLNFHSYERDKDGKAISTAAPSQAEVLQAQEQSELQVNKTVQEMDTGPLYKRVYHVKGLSKEDHTDAAIELHQRFALPLACVLLALVGIPLGISSRKGGKSAAFVLTVLLAFGYYLGYITLLGLAKKGSLPVPVAAWTPNVIFAVTGLILLLRLEKTGDTDITAWVQTLWLRVVARISSLHSGISETRTRIATPSRMPAFWLKPMLIDGYVLNGFIFYFLIMVFALVSLIEIFTFFELLGDMVKNDIGFSTMIDYLWHLAPSLIYQITPFGTLVASLVCFGLLTKHNEVTAFKAGGISVHRLAAPVLVASFAISLLLFGFDHFYIPEANRRQEMLRAVIKNKPVATYLRLDRQWVFGSGTRVYNFLRLDPATHVMTKANVYELDPRTYRVVHQISAERARWDDKSRQWVFENGLSQDGHGAEGTYREFLHGTATFPELTETPTWFVKEEKEYKEMNFQELRTYIAELQASGLDTASLQVQWHKKFSVPLFALIMPILSVPFAFLAGNRGTMAGVSVSLLIALGYWTIGTVFEQLGDLNQLPAIMAAWSPDVIFTFAGLYLVARMRT